MHISTLLPLLIVSLVQASSPVNETKRGLSFEWTAWGDSYASGVGSGKYLGGRRCLRYDQAYPVQISNDPDGIFPGQGGRFNNAVCSGAKAEEVEQYQFYSENEKWGEPNWQYYPRPSSGKPALGTLTVGGDDIDFPGILSNCILEGFPWPLSEGFQPRSCDDQRSVSWGLICQYGDHDTPNADLVRKIDSLIKKIVQFGQAASQDVFRLYVTGYGQFFNEEDKGCDTVTFARKANPHPDGKKHTLMTTDLRADFNAMSRTLNKAIQQAVDANSGSNVKYIDIDTMLDGHRFCEAGVQEPDQNNPNIWFWHYPYNQNDDDTDPGISYLNLVAQNSANSLPWNPSTSLYVDYVNAFWSTVDEEGLLRSVGATSEDDPNAYNFWATTIGSRARIFHPQVTYHESIYKAILSDYKNFLGVPDLPPLPGSSGSTPGNGPVVNPSLDDTSKRSKRRLRHYAGPVA